MTPKVAFICDPTRISAKIQALGERIHRRPVHPAMPYHVAWATDTHYYDMNWKFRKVPITKWKSKNVILFDSPVDAPVDYLEFMVGKRYYGTIDVILNPILTPLGINAPGTHCAEAINDDLWFHGYRSPFLPYGAPPTPHQMLWWLENMK